MNNPLNDKLKALLSKVDEKNLELAINQAIEVLKNPDNSPIIEKMKSMDKGELMNKLNDVMEKNNLQANEAEIRQKLEGVDVNKALDSIKGMDKEVANKMKEIIRKVDV